MVKSMANYESKKFLNSLDYMQLSNILSCSQDYILDLFYERFSLEVLSVMEEGIKYRVKDINSLMKWKRFGQTKEAIRRCFSEKMVKKIKEPADYWVANIFSSAYGDVCRIGSKIFFSQKEAEEYVFKLSNEFIFGKIIKPTITYYVK